MKKTSLIYWTLFIVVLFGLPNNAVAQEDFSDDSQCGNGMFIAQKQVEASLGYRMFARLGGNSQEGEAVLSIQQQGGTCSQTRPLKLSGSRWSYVGEFSGSKDMTMFSLDVLHGNTEINANRPLLMLVPSSNPICEPTDECRTVISGESAYLRPPAASPLEDTLGLVVAVNPADDMVVGVDYYVENRLMYRTSKLQAFDMRYVPGGRQKLTRIIRYKSGQRAFLESVVTQSSTAGFYNYVYTLTSGYRLLLLLAAASASLFILLSAIRFVANRIFKYYSWKINHDMRYIPWFAKLSRKLGANSSVHGFLEKYYKTSRAVTDFFELRAIRWSRKSLLAVSLVTTLFLLLNTYAFRVFTVDGVSMRSTLSNGEKLYVDSLGPTWSRVNNKEYVPGRGEVIVFRQPSSLDFDVDSSGDASLQTYLVKRVIGLPGERVTTKNGTITVFNSEYPQGFNPDDGSSWQAKMHTESTGDIDITLGDSEVFVCGDNRPHSIDSRYWGAVSVDAVVGKVPFTVWPFKNVRRVAH